MKTLELTQKELDRKIGEARQQGYDMGVTHGRAESLPYRNKLVAVKGIKLLDALTDFFDERYKQHEEDY